MPQATKPTWTNILKDVRVLISDGPHKFICHAITQAVCAPKYETYGYQAEKLVRKYQRRIAKQLGESPTYEDWISKNHRHLFLEMMGKGFNKGFKEGRLLWIDDMIRRANGK